MFQLHKKRKGESEIGIVLNRGNVQRARKLQLIDYSRTRFVYFVFHSQRNIFYFEEKYFVFRTYTYHIVGKNWQR